MKFPHMPYFETSDTLDSDEEPLSAAVFGDHELLITIKMDGSNVVLTRDRVAARNGQTADHRSFDLLKQLYAGFRRGIDDDLILFGEWLLAKHSIHYVGDLRLSHYLQLFAVFCKSKNRWCRWDAVEVQARKLCVFTVPVIRRGLLGTAEGIREDIRYQARIAIAAGHEGVVVRRFGTFTPDEFATSTAKHVRANHVQTDEHWRHRAIVKNQVKST